MDGFLCVCVVKKNRRQPFITSAKGVDFSVCVCMCVKREMSVLNPLCAHAHSTHKLWGARHIKRHLEYIGTKGVLQNFERKKI